MRKKKKKRIPFRERRGIRTPKRKREKTVPFRKRGW